MPKPLTGVVRELRKESNEKSEASKAAERKGKIGDQLCYLGEAAALRKASDMIEQWMQDILRAPECSVADALGVEDGDE